MTQRTLRTIIILLLAFQASVCAQITISDVDFLAMQGKTVTYDNDARFSFSIDVGMPGANQTWDMTQQAIPNPEVIVYSLLDPQETPYDTLFPTANLAARATDPDLAGFEGYSYWLLSPDSWNELGSVSISPPPFDTTLIKQQQILNAPLPLQFNDTWTTVTYDTSGDYPAFASIEKDSTVAVVDGWGTLKLPIGDFQCLRVQNRIFSESYTVVNGVTFLSGTESYYLYIWTGKEYYELAYAQSQSGSTNPNFTDAQGYGAIAGIVTNIGEPAVSGVTAGDFRLLQNYPNPFNPSTTISFELNTPQRVQVRVFDLAGREVAVLLDEYLPGGKQAIRWNAAGLSSGTYFIRVETPNQQTVRKALLVK